MSFSVMGMMNQAIADLALDEFHLLVATLSATYSNHLCQAPHRHQLQMWHMAAILMPPFCSSHLLGVGLGRGTSEDAFMLQVGLQLQLRFLTRGANSPRPGQRGANAPRPGQLGANAQQRSNA
eukprot:jgi/Tetstr1/443378/TSEL_031393.t1